jgi:methyl acetate hydrolase
MNRRQFGGTMLALGARELLAGTGGGIDDALRKGRESRGIPAVTAIVANPDRVLYSSAFGKRDGTSGPDVTPDSLFRIASMTKAITTTAAMQMVEQGKVTLDEPVSKHLPALGSLPVLDGFDSADKPMLRPQKKDIALKHLLTHTSGCVYPTWDAVLRKYVTTNPPPATDFLAYPQRFDPGARWEYGTGIDWAGRLVEKLSGLTLEDYFQRNILQPLAMKDTSFICPPEKFERLVNLARKQGDGSFKEDTRTQPAVPKTFGGGGGLYSSVTDYVRFTQMILRKGRGPGGEQVLKAKTVELMMANQIGSRAVEELKSTDPATSADANMHPGAIDKYTFGFLLNPTAYPGGRSAGSLAWAGIDNTFYWIDPHRKLTAVIMMQFLPFVDQTAVAMLGDFEKAVYATFVK